MDHLDVDRAVLVERLLRRVAGADLRLPAPGPRAGRGGHRAVGTRQTHHRCLTGARPQKRFDDVAAECTTAGTSTTATTGCRTGRRSWTSSSASCAAPRTRRSCSRTSPTGPGRAPGEIQVATRARSGVRRDRRAGRADAARHPAARCWSSPGPRTACQPQERFDTVARLTGAERLVLEGAGPPADGPGPGRGQPRDQELRRPRRGDAAAGSRPVARRRAAGSST